MVLKRNRPGFDLVQIIKDNPGCYAEIDNDHWTLYRTNPQNNPHDYDEDTETQGDEDAYEKWEEDNVLCQAGDNFTRNLGDGGYGSGNCYGGDILQALAVIVGITVSSV